MSQPSNREKCRQAQWKKAIPPSSFNEKMGYGDRSKVFHTKLANLIDFVDNHPYGADIKEHKRMIYDIKEAYRTYFGHSLSDMVIEEE